MLWKVWLIAVGLGLGVALSPAFAVSRDVVKAVPAYLVLGTPALKLDLNGDGKIDRQDLLIVVANFNTSNSVADVNGDGKVNIIDLALIGKVFGE